MARVLLLNDTATKTLFAVVSENDNMLHFHGVTEAGKEWARWVESQSEPARDLTEVAKSADYGLTADGPKVLTKTLRIELSDYLPLDAPSAKALGVELRQREIDYRALAAVSDRRLAAMAYAVKQPRAFFDPDLGPSGGFRCPLGTPNGGQITDRFGRNCGLGVARRLANRIDGGNGGLSRQVGSRRQSRPDSVSERVEDAKPTLRSRRSVSGGRISGAGGASGSTVDLAGSDRSETVSIEQLREENFKFFQEVDLAFEGAKNDKSVGEKEIDEIVKQRKKQIREVRERADAEKDRRNRAEYEKRYDYLFNDVQRWTRLRKERDETGKRVQAQLNRERQFLTAIEMQNDDLRERIERGNIFDLAEAQKRRDVARGSAEDLRLALSDEALDPEVANVLWKQIAAFEESADVYQEMVDVGERMRANPVPDLPEGGKRPKPARGLAVLASDPDGALLGRRETKNGYALPVVVPVGHKNIYSARDAVRALQEDKIDLADVPDQFLAESIATANKRFEFWFDGDGVNGLTMYKDKVTGKGVGIKFLGGEGYGAQEDLNELVAHHLAERFGFPMGSIRVGGKPDLAAGEKAAAPIVVEHVENIIGSVRAPNEYEFSNADLVRGILLDFAILNSDRHEGNFFMTMDSEGVGHFVPIDHGHAFNGAANIHDGNPTLYGLTLYLDDYQGGGGINQMLPELRDRLQSPDQRDAIANEILQLQESLRRQQEKYDLNDAISSIFDAVSDKAPLTDEGRNHRDAADRIKFLIVIDRMELLDALEGL